MARGGSLHQSFTTHRKAGLRAAKAPPPRGRAEEGQGTTIKSKQSVSFLPAGPQDFDPIRASLPKPLMSYLVLARKYRPQTFSQVVGQEHVTKTLSNAFVQDRVHHAFLFCGPRGCGKTTTARILSKALNCESGPTPEPCGTCDACVSITKGTAVDYFEMDGASNRGIDSIRDLTEAVRYQPAVLRKKVYVIDEVHMLTTEAFNALLKTLEEPPEHVTFVMATTEPHKVPNTILSRCQRFDFKLVPSAKLIGHIAEIFQKEEIPVDAGALSLIARESGGSVRDALSLCDQLISYVGTDGIGEEKVAEVLGVADRSLVRTLIDALSVGDAKTCLEAVDGAINRGVDEVQIARAVVRSLRDLAVLQAAPGSEELVEGSAEERKKIAEQAAKVAPSRVQQMFDRMLATCNELGSTEQPRLVLDMGLIEVAATEATLPLGDLIGRLTAMEKRIANRGGGSATGKLTGGGSGHAAAPTSTQASKTASVDTENSSYVGRPSTTEMPTPSTAKDLAAAEGSALIGRETSEASTSPAPSPVAASTPAPAASTPAPADASTPTPAAVAPTPTTVAAAPTTVAEVPEPSPAPVAAAPAAPADSVPAADPPASAPQPSQAADPGFSSQAHDPLLAWESVMSGLDKVKEYSLMTVYQTAKVLSWQDGRVKVGFSAGALTTEIAMEKEKVARLQSFLCEHTGQDLRFEVCVLTSEEEKGAVSVIENAQKKIEQDRVDRMEEAKNHPMTKKVLRTFGAVIKEVRIDDV